MGEYSQFADLSRFHEREKRRLKTSDDCVDSESRDETAGLTEKQMPILFDIVLGSDKHSQKTTPTIPWSSRLSGQFPPTETNRRRDTRFATRRSRRYAPVFFVCRNTIAMRARKSI